MANFAVPVEVCSDLKSCNYDGIVVVASSVDEVPFNELKTPLKAVVDLDLTAEKGVFLVPSGLPSKRIVFSGVGDLDKDYEDVRW